MVAMTGMALEPVLARLLPLLLGGVLAEVPGVGTSVGVGVGAGTSVGSASAWASGPPCRCWSP